MSMIDYESVKDIYLRDSGLLSSNSSSLIDFINANRMDKVSTFLDNIDNEKINVRTFRDTYNEARGLADLLKLKYFNISLITDSYLDSVVLEHEFNVYGGYSVLAVNDMDGNKVNIYSAITRLGFNSREREIILDRKYSDIESKKLIDVLYLVYEESRNKEYPNFDKEVFCNKLLLILSYYKKRHNLNSDMIKMEDVNFKLEEYGCLLKRIQLLNIRKEEMEEFFSRNGIDYKGVSK